MSKNSMLPATIPYVKGDSEAGLVSYLQEIKRFPILTSDEEYRLGKRWHEDQDSEAAHRLVTSHLRLVVKIASGFRGYGLPFSELISEGNIGLMQAVKRFDADRGFRLATYAMWWIRASIQEYVLRSWSMVKIGTTGAQKKLFFNLKRMKRKLHAIEEGDLSPENLKTIASELMVGEDEVTTMNRRMQGGDLSLNSPIRQDGEQDGEWMDLLESDSATPEQTVIQDDWVENQHRLLYQAMEGLNSRERMILTARRLQEPPATLETLSQKHGVSRERIRQIENRAFEKIQSTLLIG